MLLNPSDLPNQGGMNAKGIESFGRKTTLSPILIPDR